MQPIISEDTGAAVAWCVPQSATETAFDKAYDRAKDHFKLVETDTEGDWIRFKSALAFPNTAHPPKPMSTATEDPKTEEQIILHLTEAVDGFKPAAGDNPEKLIDTLCEQDLSKETLEEIEAILSTEIGRQIAQMGGRLGIDAGGKAAKSKF